MRNIAVPVESRQLPQYFVTCAMEYFVIWQRVEDGEIL